MILALLPHISKCSQINEMVHNSNIKLNRKVRRVKPIGTEATTTHLHPSDQQLHTLKIYKKNFMLGHILVMSLRDDKTIDAKTETI